MRKKIVLLMMLISSFSAFSQLKYSKVRIYGNLSDLKEIRQCGIDLENMSGKPGLFIDVEISEIELNKIADKGFKYEILIDDMSTFYKKRYEESVIKNNHSLKGINYVTPVNFNYGSMGGFLTLAEIYAELDQMKSLYPDLITLRYTIGNTQTYDSRSIYAVKISDNPDTNEEEPEVLYTSLTHAREPAAMQGLIWFMWYLLENYDSDQEINYLVNNLEMFFVPVVNPDGYEYNRTTDPTGGGMWRKNKRDNNGGGFNGYGDGVDLNRNFGYNWGYDNEGSSPYASDETYRGTAGFSEPETQILRDFCNEHQFVMAHNHHTYSNLLIIPWGYDELITPDDAYYRASANLMASENGYTVGQGWQILYVVNGDSNDWMYGEQGTKPKIFAYTQETGSSGFWPSQSEIIQLCEECYLSNLYLARFATPYAELSDNSPNYIPRTGYIKFNLKRMGLSGNGNYSVTIVPDNTVFSSLGSSKEIQLNDVMSTQTDSILYVLSDAIEYGDSFSYTITVSAGTYSISKTFTKSYYLTEIILVDPGNTTGNWTTSEWSVTDDNYWSPSSSITDSDGGDYSSDENNSITLVNQISLTGIENPRLSFWAKWNIENNWDYVQLFISTNNGSSWTPLATEFTNLGVSNQTGAYNEPLFDGSSNWVENSVNLNTYIGQNVKFRFELHSDGSVEEDGFYFDDFTITSTLSSPLAANLTATPGCGENSGTVTVYSTVSGTQTFYLRDNSGNPISDWTGDAETHDFTGLSDGIYKAQVEQEGEMSSLSSGVELMNTTLMPEVPESVQSSDHLICSGANATLSYTGGSGVVFEWFETTCGEGMVGNGNNLIVNPTVETTYYGRWSNACGNSDCESVTIAIADPTDIVSDPEDVNASQGDAVSFTVDATGNNLNYQWRKNGGTISGATESSYSITNVQVSDQGLYDVIVSGECGTLTSESATLTVSSGISAQTEFGFDIYPNPTSGLFTINTNNKDDRFEYELTDINGKTLLKGSTRSGQTTLSLKNSTSGMYFLHIRTDSKLYVYKIMKD
jgi:hypothetical protein